MTPTRGSVTDQSLGSETKPATCCRWRGVASTIYTDFISDCSQSCHPLSTLTNGALPPIILFILLWMVCLFSRQPATFFPEVMLTECSIPLAPLLCWVVVRLSKKSKGNFEQYFHDNLWGLFERAVVCLDPRLIVFLLVMDRLTCYHLLSTCHVARVLCVSSCFLSLRLLLKPNVLFQLCLVLQIVWVSGSSVNFFTAHGLEESQQHNLKLCFNSVRRINWW